MDMVDKPIDELVASRNFIEHIVIDKDTYKVSLLKSTKKQKREFSICAAETKKNISLTDAQEIFACVTEFIKNNPQVSPCYSILDVSKTETFTLHQLKYAASAFMSIKSFIESSLVGTILKISDTDQEDSFIVQAFQALYTPIRPICWYNNPGDAEKFVKECEEKLN
tara:strand:- start:2956 stop:3456 length:501 start_codon:yes stop_codon:yes gene_type:complete